MERSMSGIDIYPLLCKECSISKNKYLDLHSKRWFNVQ